MLFCRRRGRSVAAADSPFGDLWSDDDDTDDAEDLTLTERLEETIDMARSWGVGVGGGLADRVSYEASQSTPWADPPNLSAEATDTRETINGNSTQIVDYLNNQTDAANASVDNTTVHELRLVDEDHALSESIYLVFEYDQTTGQWTTLTAHESYNGSADYEHRFSGFLATNTADETDRFVTEYVADGEPIASDRAYNAGVLSRYAGPFGSDAESTLLDDGFDGFEDGRTRNGFAVRDRVGTRRLPVPRCPRDVLEPHRRARTSHAGGPDPTVDLGATDEYVGVGQDPVPTCARLPGDTLRANDGQRRARGHAGHRLDRLSDVGRADLHLPVPVRRRPSDPAGRPGVAAHRLSG